DVTTSAAIMDSPTTIAATNPRLRMLSSFLTAPGTAGRQPRAPSLPLAPHGRFVGDSPRGRHCGGTIFSLVWTGHLSGKTDREASLQLRYPVGATRYSPAGAGSR